MFFYGYVDGNDEVRATTAIIHPRRTCMPRQKTMLKDFRQVNSIPDGRYSGSLNPDHSTLIFLYFQFYFGVVTSDEIDKTVVVEL